MWMNILPPSHEQQRDVLIEICARQRQHMAICIHQIQQPLHLIGLALHTLSLLKQYRSLLFTALVVTSYKHRKWLMHSWMQYKMAAMVKHASSSRWLAQLQVFIQTIWNAGNDDK